MVSLPSSEEKKEEQEQEEEGNSENEESLEKLSGSSDTEHSINLFVGGLSPDTTVATLKAYFEQKFDARISCNILIDKKKVKSRGFGFV